MFYYQNLLGMLTKKMETKSRKIQNHKTQSTEKRFVVKIFSKCQLEKWKENQGKFRITKAQISEKKPKRMAAFCSESFKNLCIRRKWKENQLLIDRRRPH